MDALTTMRIEACLQGETDQWWIDKTPGWTAQQRVNALAEDYAHWHKEYLREMRRNDREMVFGRADWEQYEHANRMATTGKRLARWQLIADLEAAL